MCFLVDLPANEALPTRLGRRARRSHASSEEERTATPAREDVHVGLQPPELAKAKQDPPKLALSAKRHE